VTDIEYLRMGLMVARNTLEAAMSETDIDDMEALAVRAVNRILESSRPRPTAVVVPFRLADAK
jgi:hypothetical protein